MKKVIILLLVIVHSSVIVAQQRKLPSFQEFLNKKDFSLSTPPGSSIPLPPGFGKFPSSKFPEDYLASRIDVTKRMLANAAHPKFSHRLPNGNMVFLLPQDNMPCVVPSMENYNMPVAKVGLDYDKQIHAIPPVLSK